MSVALFCLISDISLYNHKERLDHICHFHDKAEPFLVSTCCCSLLLINCLCSFNLKEMLNLKEKRYSSNITIRTELIKCQCHSIIKVETILKIMFMFIYTYIYIYIYILVHNDRLTFSDIQEFPRESEKAMVYDRRICTFFFF